MATPVTALTIPGGITDEYKHVHRRKQDELPTHVKGEGVVYREFSTTTTAGKIHPRTGYYIEETDEAIECLKDEEEDAWFLLQQDTSGRFVTCKDNRLDRYAKKTGYWYFGDEQHPEYHLLQQVENQPHEELVAEGLHHIVTLQGPQAQLSPTHQVLPVIERAASLGESIPTDIQPIASTSAVVMSQPVQISTQLTHRSAQSTSGTGGGSGGGGGGGSRGTTGQGGNPPARGNGALKGSPPPIFKGERSKSTKFLMAFTIFRVANRSNETLTNPVTRVATALTYMDGPLVDPWKEDQLRKLEARITAGTADTDEAHWTAFK